tara:strand:+ start:147 stop:1340 length:1194 start_codon:yes stop_codon:yes gene_type:complete
MSTIEVDKVIPQSGTALQVGEAGDTVNIVGTLQNNGAELTGDISSVVAGTGLAGGGTTGDVTLNIEAAQPTITSTGTLTSFRSTGIDDNSNALAMTIDSSENIGIGTASPLSPFHVASATADADGSLGSQAPQMILQGGTGNQNNRFEFGMDSSGGTAIGFLQSRNTVSGVQHLSLNPKGGNVGIGTTSPISGYNLSLGKSTNVSGEFTGITFQESTSNFYGYVRAEDNATPDTSFVIGHTVRGIVFKPGDTERVRMDGDGIKFNGDTAAANGLNDYEEGTWTAGVNQGTVNNIASSYIKVGDKVTVWSNIDTFSNRTSTETVEVSGLPFAIASATQGKAVGSVLIRYSDKLVSGSYSRSSSAIGFYASIAGGYVPLKFNDLNNSSANMTFIATYTV